MVSDKFPCGYLLEEAGRQRNHCQLYKCAGSPLPVSPEISQKRGLHYFSDATWIIQLRYAFVEKFEDTPGGLCVKLGQFTVREWRNFNLPSHDAS